MKEDYIIRNQEKIHFITGTELYYTLRTHEVTTDTETLAIKRASDGQTLATDFGDLRANKNGKFYYFAQDKNVGEEFNLTATNEVTLTNVPASNNGVTGYQPYQQYTINGVTPAETNGIVYRDIGKKYYELKDHLGNIRVVVSDRKELNTVDNTLTASVVSYNNYYPFGMLQPNRNFNSPEYRYGFQGQEKDSEIKGEGNSINYKYRMHDPRVGRFFAVDPLTKKYPHYSPYSFSGNKVIAFVELEGLEEAKFNRQIAIKVAPKLGMTSDEFMRETNIVVPIRNLKTSLFKLPWASGGTAEALVNHYSYGNGNTFELSRSQILEIYPTYTVSGGKVEPIDLSLTSFDFFSKGDIPEGKSKFFTKSVAVYAGVPGTLGNFSVVISGLISIDSKTKQRIFNGEMVFKDTYDFNAAKHRPLAAEGQVTIARWFLPGQSFEIKGTLKVQQTINQPLMTPSASGSFFSNPAAVKKPSMNGEYDEMSGEAGEGGN